MNQFEEIIKTLSGDLIMKYEDVNERLTSVESEIRVLRACHEEHVGQCENPVANPIQTDPLSNTDVTVVAKNIPQAEGETMATLELVIGDVLSVLGVVGTDMTSPVKVVKFARLPSRYGNPGLVKISFETLDQKKRVLKNKQKLQNTRFKNVWMWGSKTHTERLLEINTRKLLDKLPFGHGLHMTANGRLIEQKHNFEINNNYEQEFPHLGGPPHRGRGRGQARGGASRKQHGGPRGYGIQRGGVTGGVYKPYEIPTQNRFSPLNVPGFDDRDDLPTVTPSTNTSRHISNANATNNGANDTLPKTVINDSEGDTDTLPKTVNNESVSDTLPKTVPTNDADLDNTPAADQGRVTRSRANLDNTSTT